MHNGTVVFNLLNHGILHYFLSADLLIRLLTLFSIDYVNIWLSSISFSTDSKVWGYPTLLILWFINFKWVKSFKTFFSYGTKVTSNWSLTCFPIETYHSRPRLHCSCNPHKNRTFFPSRHNCHRDT